MAPINQNATPQEPAQPAHPTPTPTAASNPLSSPSVVQAGEVMLVISLVLILLVVVSIAVHFYLKRTKRRRRVPTKTKKCETIASQPEVQNQVNKLAEVEGIPLCEMGDSEPRHEMEDAEVPQRYTMVEPESPRDHPVYVVSPLEPYPEAWPLFGDMTTRATAQPEAGVHAAYLAR